MFNIGLGEFLLCAAVALFVVGPQRLPKLAADAGRLLRRLRMMAQETSNEMRAELGPDFAHMDLADLHPRRFVRKHLLEGLDDDLMGDPALTSPAVRAADRPVDDVSARPMQPGERPPYDADAT